MKIKYFAVVLISVIVFNCSNSGSGGDDGILNGSNYISENNLYISYLTAELEAVQVEIDSLQMVIDTMTGDALTEEYLIDALATRDDLDAKREEVYLSGNPVPLNTPPGSCPEVLTCFPSDVLYFVTSNAFHDLDIIIYDAENNVIADTLGSPFNDLPGVNDFRYQEISILDYTGPVTFTVSKYDIDEELVGYFIAGYIY